MDFRALKARHIALGVVQRHNLHWYFREENAVAHLSRISATRKCSRIWRMGFRAIRLLIFVVGIMVIGVPFSAQEPVLPPANLPSPVTPPKILSGEDRVIPQCAGITPADVKLEFIVTVDGDAKEIHVLESPSDKHSACATEMVRGTKFLPAMQDGNAVQIKMVLTLSVKAHAS